MVTGWIGIYKKPGYLYQTSGIPQPAHPYVYRAPLSRPTTGESILQHDSRVIPHVTRLRRGKFVEFLVISQFTDWLEISDLLNLKKQLGEIPANLMNLLESQRKHQSHKMKVVRDLLNLKNSHRMQKGICVTFLAKSSEKYWLSLLVNYRYQSTWLLVKVSKKRLWRWVIWQQEICLKMEKNWRTVCHL